jgi:hypothetical protein
MNTSVANSNPDPDPSIKNSKKNLDSYCFVNALSLFLSLKNDVNVTSKSKKQKTKK